MNRIGTYSEKTLEEKINARHSDNPPALDSTPPWQGEFENLEVINYLTDTHPMSAFRDLYKHDTNTPEYAIASGEVYERVRSAPESEGSDAVDVSRLLNQGQVRDAERKVEEMLE